VTINSHYHDNNDWDRNCLSRYCFVRENAFLATKVGVYACHRYIPVYSLGNSQHTISSYLTR